MSMMQCKTCRQLFDTQSIEPSAIAAAVTAASTGGFLEPTPVSP